MRLPARLTVALALLPLAACSGENGPFVEIEGGGFIFNYRIAEVTAGFVARPLRQLPEGAALEAEFENPSGGAPIVLKQQVMPKAARYSFTTPPLAGVRAEHDYVVTLVLRDAGGEELQRLEKAFRSEVDQSVMPDKPLTIGPGYAPNPDASAGEAPR